MPVRVEVLELIDDSIVLTDENSVQRSEGRMLIGSLVTC